MVNQARKKRYLPKRTLIILGVIFALILAFILSIPSVGRWYISNKLIPRVEKRLKRTIDIGETKLGFSRLILRNIVVRSDDKKEKPLVRVVEASTHFSIWRAIFGKLRLNRVDIYQPKIFLYRDASGESNFLDLIRNDKKKKRVDKKSASRSLLFETLYVKGGSLTLKDELKKIDATVDDLSAQIKRDQLSRVEIKGVKAHLLPPAPKKIKFDKIEIEGVYAQGKRELKQIKISGGEVGVLPRLELSALNGILKPNLKEKTVQIDLAGSYGGASAQLWSAKGNVDLNQHKGKLNISAERFRLDRIASILKHTPIIKPDRTTIDGQLVLSYENDQLHFIGDLGVVRMNLYHPGLSRQAIYDLSGSLKISGHASASEVVLNRAAVQSNGVSLELSGKIESIKDAPKIQARLVMAQLPCQRLLDAIPAALIPKLTGFKLKGKIDADWHLDVDYEKLKELKLGGRFPMMHCKVVEAPFEVSAERLQEAFEFSVPVTPEENVHLTLGPENPDYIQYEAISKYVMSAFFTTEDGGFFRHRGFLTSQFRSALARNLARGGFRLGASTISMQMVKNVLLTHEKTLSRKLQELFLVWYLEQELTKERILEIYLNAIEFGPRIYGVGKAARHYFGISAADINPLQAAYFASILPSPKRRYKHYCKGELSPKWDKYVRRILKRMMQRGHITDEEYQAWAEAPFSFARDNESFSEKDCLERIETLQEGVQEGYWKKLKESVEKFAPHQLQLYISPKMPPKKKK